MDVPVVILAGGQSRRMGRDKLELTLNGRTLLESAVNRFSEVFDELYISVADAEKYRDIVAKRVVDIFRGAGPLSGLHAALESLPGDGVFLVAADLPFSCPLAAKHIIKLCEDNDACIIRLPDGRLEPLFGYYRKALLPMCEEAIKSGDYRMSELIFVSKTRFVDPAELGELWDDKMVMNINSPDDFANI